MIRALTFLDCVGTMLSPCALRRKHVGKESRCVSVPNPHTELAIHSGIVVTEDTPFTCNVELL